MNLIWKYLLAGRVFAIWMSVLFVLSILVLSNGCTPAENVFLPGSSAYRLEFSPMDTIRFSTGGEEDWIIASIRSAIRDQAGDFVFVDDNKGEVWKTDQSGVRIGPIGRKGGGPKEYREPAGVSIDPEGNYGIFDLYGNRLQVYSPDNEHLKTIHIPTDTKTAIFDDEGNVLCRVRKQDFLYHLYDKEGRVIQRYMNVSVLNKYIDVRGIDVRNVNQGIAAKGDSVLTISPLDNQIRVFNKMTGQEVKSILVDDREMPINTYELSKTQIDRVWNNTAHLIDIYYLSEAKVVVVLVMVPEGEQFAQKLKYKIYDLDFNIIDEIPKTLLGFIIHAHNSTLYGVLRPELDDDGNLPNPTIKVSTVSLTKKT